MTFTDNEKIQLSIIESNIQHHNAKRRKNKITISTYIASGNRIDILLDGKLLAGMLTAEEAYFFIFGLVAYAEKTGGKTK